jgi:hypothetical protein
LGQPAAGRQNGVLVVIDRTNPAAVIAFFVHGFLAPNVIDEPI